MYTKKLLEKKITVTRGLDHPYRILNYKWIPIQDVPDPLVVKDYTIRIYEYSL